MKRWSFTYHFRYVLVKHSNQTVVTNGSHWTAAAAKADREVSKRPGIKGQHGADKFTRACYPIIDAGTEA